MTKVLICSDLDRTILPNGAQPESPMARVLLERLANRSEVILTYVSGRNKKLLLQAIEEYRIPMPDFAVGDVGTTIYLPGKDWQQLAGWQQKIGNSWNGYQHRDLADFLSDFSELVLQEKEKQNIFKLSYYIDPERKEEPLKQKINQRLSENGIQAGIIFSIDEQAKRGLLDILPKNATKLEAIRFIQRKRGIPDKSLVFAGDSGNDLTVLTSSIQAILVKNASSRVRQAAIETMAKKGELDKLYLARGQFLGMNGNYSAGLLEGVAHFLPRTLDWLANAE